MPFFLKNLVFLGLFTIVAFFISLGIASNPAFAPETTVPKKITKSDQNKVPTTTPQENGTLDQTTSEPEPERKPEPLSETPSVPAEDPFQGLADAFAELAKEQQLENNAPPNPSEANDLVRAALVNILCTTNGSGPFNPISASGIIIDSRGVILTNAHVAQFFLLKDYPTPDFVDCVIRTGSPAVPTYSAELLFISPSWVRENADKIDDKNPTGNGEHDYALLRITGAINQSTSLPQNFAYTPVALIAPDTGTSVVVAGYPAGFLGGITVQKDLYAASANATVGQLYTYGGDTTDLFSIGGSVVAQQGSSGGAVANQNGTLLGMIVTSSIADDTANRDLRALSTEYIVRDFEKEAGASLSTYLTGNIAENARLFNMLVSPTLTKLITNVLDN